MARRIYVASSWRNPYQPIIVAHLRAEGHDVYDFRNPRPGDYGFQWSEIDPNWQNWTPSEYRNALRSSVARKGFNSDFAAMQWADTCVLVLPCGRSAHLEAGYFVGAEKELFILQLDKHEPELMYKMASSLCLDVRELIEQLGD